MRTTKLLALAATLAACSDPRSRSDYPTAVPDPAQAAGRQSGAVIIRFEGNTPEVGLFIYDADRQLLAGLATDDSHFGCVPGTELGHSTDMLVETPAGATTYLSRVDQVYLTIYDWNGVGSITCALLTGPSAIATGIVPGVLNSNDIFNSGGHGQTFGMRVGGPVTSLVTGEALHATAAFLDLVTGSGAVKSLTARVVLSREPVD